MIKSVVFDVGGVIKSDSAESIEKFVCNKLEISKEQYYKVNNEIFPSFNKGEMSEFQYWKLFLKKLNSTKPIKSVKNVWKEAHQKTFKINNKVVNIVKKIKKKGFKLAILSNATKSNVEINKKGKIYNLFETCILSSEVGLIKPDPKIYKLTLSKINAKPEETLFIDDRESNTKAAKKLGIKTILFKNSEQLEKELKQFKIL